MRDDMSEDLGADHRPTGGRSPHDHPAAQARMNGEVADEPDGDAASSRQLVMRPRDTEAPLAERIARIYYRLAWRSPFHSSRIGGKLPPRFRAIPVSPLPGQRARGDAIRLGYFLFHGIRQPFDRIDYARMQVPAAYVDYIHRFAWLRDLAAAIPAPQGRLVAERLVGDWLDVHDVKVTQPAWRPDSTAWRLINWATYAPYLLASSDLIYRSRVLRHVSRMARHLDRTAARAGSGQARLTAWVGVVAAGLLLPEGRGRRLVGEAELASALTEVIYPDGGVVSRSPLVLIEIIELLVMLLRCYEARGNPPPETLVDALDRAVGALLGLTHSDGGLGAWQGAATIAAEHIAPLVAASGVRTRPRRQARDWGYQRVAAGRSVLQLDAAPPPLARQSIAGCASTLAIEFSHGADRIFVSCGGAALTGATIPIELARGLRTTAAHSTLCLADTNSTAILPGGKLGRGVSTVELDRRETADATRLEVSHDGYDRAFGLVHRRQLMVQTNGLQLRGDDLLLPGVGRKRSGDQPFHIRFHLGPHVECDIGADRQSAVLRLPAGSYWQFRAVDHQLSCEESLWVDADGVPRPGLQLVITGEAGAGGINSGWLLKHMG